MDATPVIAPPQTPLSLLEKVVSTTLLEYVECYKLDVPELYRGLVYIRYRVEPMLLPEEAKLRGVYTRIREGFPESNYTKGSDITIRFLIVVMSRWFMHIGDQLGISPKEFIESQSKLLAQQYSCMSAAPELVSDTIGQTLDEDVWVMYLTSVPILLTAFHLKSLLIDYVPQLHDYLKHVPINDVETIL